MSQRPTLDLENFLPYRLTLLASHVAVTFAKQHAQRFGISIPEWRVIATLGRNGSLTSGSLTERTGMDKAKVSRAVSRLQAAGLVERQVNAEDLRSAYLHLSDAGKAVHDKIVPIALELERDLVSSLSPEELRTFKDMLVRLDKHVAEKYKNDLEGDPHI